MFKTGFAKNIALVASGTGFAQVLGILFYPLITRIYSADEYGVLTVYSVTLALIVIIATLDYYKAIPIADNDENAINILALSTGVLLFFVIIITILLTIWDEKILGLLNSEALIKYKYFIPFGVFFTGAYYILQEWALRMRNYKQITKTKINQSLYSNILMVFLGYLKIGPIGLILGKILGQSVGVNTLFKPILRERDLFAKINIQKIGLMSKRYINFPLYTMPNHYINTGVTFFPIIFLNYLFGTKVTGLFGLANNIVNIPVNLIGASVAQVFYAEAAKVGKSNPAKLKKLSIQLIKKLALIGFVPLAIFLFLGPKLFSIFFGPDWHQAGVYAQIISIMVFFQFIASPIGRIPEIYEKQRLLLSFNFIKVIFILFIFGFSKYMNYNSFQTVGLYVSFNSLMFILLIFISQSILNKQIIKTNRK